MNNQKRELPVKVKYSKEMKIIMLEVKLRFKVNGVTRKQILIRIADIIRVQEILQKQWEGNLTAELRGPNERKQFVK